MTINLVVRWIKKRRCVLRVDRYYFDSGHHPQTSWFITAGIEVAGALQRHFFVKCVQSPNMYVGLTAFFLGKNLPEWAL